MHRLALALTIASLLWTAVLVASPHALHHQRLAPGAAVSYAAASRVCHQRTERSFRLSGTQLPVCARCLGLYASAALGSMIAWGSRRSAGRGARLALAVAAAPTALTWGAEAAGLATLSNAARAAAAVPLGLVAGWVFVQMLRYDSHRNGDQVHDRRSRAQRG